MHYTLEQLEMFQVVAQTGSFSAAARKLQKSQSTVSAAIANLEIDLGVPLFVRSGKLPQLSEAGTKLLVEAELILDRCLELDRHANSFSSKHEAILTLAIEVPYSVLIEPLRDFAEKFPYVDLEIKHPSHNGAHKLLLEGEAQLGVAFSQPNNSPDLEFVQMGKLILSHVVDRRHPLAMSAKVSFAELHSHRRLVFSAHNSRLATSEYLGASRSWQAENYQALLEMTRAGLERVMN